MKSELTAEGVRIMTGADMEKASVDNLTAPGISVSTERRNEGIETLSRLLLYTGGLRVLSVRWPIRRFDDMTLRMSTLRGDRPDRPAQDIRAYCRSREHGSRICDHIGCDHIGCDTDSVPYRYPSIMAMQYMTLFSRPADSRGNDTMDSIAVADGKYTPELSVNHYPFQCRYPPR